MKIRLIVRQILTITILFFGLILNSCKESNENKFSYEEFKDALYYNNSTGEFSDLGNLEMCINRWKMPKYIKSKGTMNRDGGNSRLYAIIFKWSNIIVDGKNVEIEFEAIPDSGKTIEDVFTNSINLNNSKYLKVKEFRLVPISKTN
ncbi:hypothetical protein [Mariniflexile sp.]|uniref:hypothetical protein n=1 Tax=Mariniflexile sp. TaxID=1979402 RepID=UPI004047FEAA